MQFIEQVRFWISTDESFDEYRQETARIRRGDPPDEVVYVHGLLPPDPNQLGQILQRIISSRIQYTPDDRDQETNEIQYTPDDRDQETDDSTLACPICFHYRMRPDLSSPWECISSHPESLCSHCIANLRNKNAQAECPFCRAPLKIKQ